MAEELINYPEALERLGGDEEFLLELLEELLVQVDENLPSIKNAVSDQQFDDLRALSHSLKGASANLNVTRMAAHFCELENRGQDKVIDDVQKFIELVENDRHELEQFLHRN